MWHRISKPLARSRLVICVSCPRRITCTKDHSLFILITQKSKRSENPTIWIARQRLVNSCQMPRGFKVNLSLHFHSNPKTEQSTCKYFDSKSNCNESSYRDMRPLYSVQTPWRDPERNNLSRQKLAEGWCTCAISCSLHHRTWLYTASIRPTVSTFHGLELNWKNVQLIFSISRNTSSNLCGVSDMLG